MIQTVQTGGIKMSFCRFGKGKKIFVILPGLSLRPVTPAEDALAAAFAAFTAEYTVYLFDRRSNVPESYTIEEMADDTAAVMKQLGLISAHVFGASQGGMIAQALAVRYPELVEKLVLGSTASCPNDLSARTVGRWIRLAREGRGGELNEALAEDIYSPATLAAFKDAILAGGADLSGEELARFVKIAEPVPAFDISGQLGEVRCPVLVIGCEGDKVLGADAARRTAQMLGARLYLYGPEYGHGVYDEAPDYRGRMLAFLEE